MMPKFQTKVTVAKTQYVNNIFRHMSNYSHEWNAINPKDYHKQVKTADDFAMPIT